MIIKNFYKTKEANKWRNAAGSLAADRDLGERVYTSRLIGLNPDLVMHGGGNTSVKVERKNLFGETERVLHVKGSGWDLDTLEAPGLPGVRLDPLCKLRNLAKLSDEDMVNIQRNNLLNSSSPNPSVETLLHAFLPHKFVDHTHATPFLILANLPKAREVCREIFGDKLAIVPYIMPGFDLAKKATQVFEKDPSVEGLLLLNHGHFAFGGTARESYNKIINHTNAVAQYFKLKNPTSIGERRPTKRIHFLPVLHGPHHSAQKSTKTGCGELITSASKEASLTTLILSFMHSKKRKLIIEFEKFLALLYHLSTKNLFFYKDCIIIKYFSSNRLIKAKWL